MIIDRDNMFTNAKAITASGASDAIDLGAEGDALFGRARFRTAR